MFHRAVSSLIQQMLTFAVIVGILLGFDARAAHLANCAKATDLCDVPSGVGAVRTEPCCDEQATVGEQLGVCLVFDNCGCCAHPPASHVCEFDGRSLQPPPAADFEALLAALAAPTGTISSINPARTIPTTDRPFPTAAIYLLLGHLLF